MQTYSLSIYIFFYMSIKESIVAIIVSLVFISRKATLFNMMESELNTTQEAVIKKLLYFCLAYPSEWSLERQNLYHPYDDITNNYCVLVNSS